MRENRGTNVSEVGVLGLWSQAGMDSEPNFRNARGVLRTLQEADVLKSDVLS